MDYSYIDRNIADIRARIERAAEERESRSPVLLLAAIKSAEVGEIKYLHEKCGVCDVGENRVQQLLARYDEIKDETLNVHFIGTLQTNKVKYIIDKVCMIHSLDSLNLAKEINKQAKKAGLVMDVLVEINCGEEENKSGILPKDAEEFCLSLSEFDSIRLRGFMTMAPKCDNFDQYRKFFQQTYVNCLDIWQKKLDNIRERPIFSMGMSDSFESAIAEGATIVRVGGALFR